MDSRRAPGTSTSELIDRLRRFPGVQVADGEAQWTVRLAKGDGREFEIVVPHQALEWFVSVRNAEGVELWSDWQDYVGYTPARPLAQLASEMRADVEWFANAALAAEGFRVVSRRWLWILGGREAEWCFAGRWRPVCMSAEADDGPGTPADRAPS